MEDESNPRVCEVIEIHRQAFRHAANEFIKELDSLVRKDQKVDLSAIENTIHAYRSVIVVDEDEGGPTYLPIQFFMRFENLSDGSNIEGLAEVLAEQEVT